MDFALKKGLLKFDFSKSFTALVKDNTINKILDYGALNDEALVAKYQKGDERAFQVLLQRHKGPVFNFIVRFLGNAEIAEDAFQEVFLRVIQSINDYRPSAKFTTWLYRVARNYCIDFGRMQKYRRHLSLDHAANADSGSLYERVVSGDENAEAIMSATELEKILLNVLAELNVEQREVFLLRETEGLSFDEIAKITKVSANTVKSRMRYAVQSLQKRFFELNINAQSISKHNT
ncbi:MAG: RNA polymerase sigma factor [Deltaproteobacteria bacterium]|nr:RNA polymerase sigma factor [Deltaproteobacteria bacterium]